MTRYIFGLDNFICKTSNKNDYINAYPLQSHIDYINNLKQNGDYVIIWTDREERSGICHTMLTYDQLNKWGVKYDKLILSKPIYDILIDFDVFNVDTIISG